MKYPTGDLIFLGMHMGLKASVCMLRLVDGFRSTDPPHSLQRRPHG